MDGRPASARSASGRPPASARPASGPPPAGRAASARPPSGPNNDALTGVTPGWRSSLLKMVMPQSASATTNTEVPAGAPAQIAAAWASVTGPLQLFPPPAPPEAVCLPPAPAPPAPPSEESPLQAPPDTIQAATTIATTTARTSLRMNATVIFVAPRSQSDAPPRNVVIQTTRTPLRQQQKDRPLPMSFADVPVPAAAGA